MNASERQAIKAALDHRARVLERIPENGRIPIALFSCPAHGSHVGLDGEGHLLGRCEGCIEEAAQGIALFTRNQPGRVDSLVEELVDAARQERE